ncbi:hypothetical protein Y1Q_0021724 [Alligator mississippiensis]|uniref:Reverse transcriptase/retrotransposon-derived protein RNase H-like domain-containing protein n=1 Tax=Alligator mississippiensis TaxID=8496 RepID=A0A151PB37_ALLMI|nr:hypothetical protein Y1Q_0021724 [Alligator mississippiensis]
MPTMTRDDNPEAYIEAFECHVVELDKGYWANQLGELIVGKAQAAYHALPRDEAHDYECMKAAILYRLEINLEHYHKLFQAKKGPDKRQTRGTQHGECKKFGNRKGWLGEVEDSEGSADEMDDIDVRDIASSLQFQETQEENQELGMLRVQAHGTRDNMTPLTNETPRFETDTSETAIRAIFTQEEDGTEGPVAYTSRKLLPAETRAPMLQDIAMIYCSLL